MPATCDVPMIRCGKCDSSYDLRMFRRRKTYDCILCGEPIKELIDLDRCDWSEGDFEEKDQ
jgi:hypothetical protein